MKKLTLALACFYLSLASISALSQGNWGVAGTLEDEDRDGLIEIDTLERLDEIRNYPQGDALFGRSRGCPAGGCVGFELVRDLDFDTNGDGKVDHRDRYWNDGEGWDPIWNFEGVFEGNNHTIKNLYINRVSASRAGLIGSTEGATIRNLRVSGYIQAGGMMNGGIVGQLINSEIENCVSSVDVNSLQAVAGGLVGASSGSTIVGNSTSGNISGREGQLGGLVGNSGNSLIINNSSSARVTASWSVGGLIGHAATSTIEENVATGNVEGNNAGGLIGYVINSYVNDNYSANRIKSEGDAGGLIGAAPDVNVIRNNYTVSAITRVKSGVEHVDVGALVGRGLDISLDSNHWATDPAGVVKESFSTTLGGATLAELKCPTSANNLTCAGIVLYDSWSNSIWDFGTSNDLPRLRTTSNFPWTSRDTPNASGDHEGTRHLKKEYPERYCDNPIAIEARIEGGSVTYRAEPDQIFDYFNVRQGLACDERIRPNGKCDDYEVSYLCPHGWSSWRSDDTPNGNGDYEKREDFVKSDESDDCDRPTEIRARRINSNDIIYGTPDKLKHFSTTKGLGCNNKDQAKFGGGDCKDYQVRLVCPMLSEK